MPSAETSSGSGLETVDIDLIVPNPYQPRMRFDTESLRLLADSIREARLPIAVELGTTTVTLGELLGIRADDVIRLDRGPETELPIRAGKRARFLGRPGTLGGNRAVQITGVPSSLLELLEEFN